MNSLRPLGPDFFLLANAFRTAGRMTCQNWSYKSWPAVVN